AGHRPDTPAGEVYPLCGGHLGGVRRSRLVPAGARGYGGRGDAPEADL
ncbi:MAG: hypothetical protein AVDCRST_MAG03-2871, partial [uncultured Rubrobacteraceae bacterium]